MDAEVPRSVSAVHERVRAELEPANCEIEELGLSALIAVLVTPAGIAAEVHYLDRSAGEEINLIPYWQRTDPPEATFRLLYRPGHYDILYKAEDFVITKSIPVTQPTQQNVFVALQHNSTEHIHQRTAFHPDAIEIPGLSFYTAPAAASWSQFNQYDITPSPISPAIASPRAPVTPSYHGLPEVQAHGMYFQNTPMSQSTMPNVSLPHHVPIDRETPFRPSAWEYEASFQSHMPHQSLCQTAIFRK
jgi:ubiquitin thioesterase protein OTUB1